MPHTLKVPAVPAGKVAVVTWAETGQPYCVVLAPGGGEIKSSHKLNVALMDERPTEGNDNAGRG